MLYAIFFNLFFLYRIYDGITENFVLFYSTTMCALCTGEHKKLTNVFLALLPIFMMIIRLSNYFEIADKHIQLNIFLYYVPLYSSHIFGYFVCMFIATNKFVCSTSILHYCKSFSMHLSKCVYLICILYAVEQFCYNRISYTFIVVVIVFHSSTIIKCAE